MYQRCRSLALHWLKVPPEPQPPAGNPASLRVFRAGKNFWNLRLLGWVVPQIVALAGIIFWTVAFIEVEHTVREHRRGSDVPPPRRPVRINSWAELQQALTNVAFLLPTWSFPLIWVFKIGGVILYLAQIPLTFAIRRLDYEMRWYVVTDRSLRIRTGVWQVQELTMSFANLQQVVVAQDPVQRLLGLADVRVQSAGGGGGHDKPGHGAGDSLHTAMFHSVENAHEIRDLILERLRVFRATGLGDPDDHHESSPPLAASTGTAVPAETLAAAHELLAEARALRHALR